CQHETNWSLTF
nr:immunoglobulin light chain junction region [Macaca mulatta]MOW51582.1 immunoglobulin light chain junction region [Macaca mulatta]MOW51619.1 immunoglobulin light chain junction region [Macaca mulatta]MOW51739.1 immunoglobulin light chain junction region [Macaca mulatta]MOW52179.1 immunoglobulin light chain junction region [Macaca mulatta]